MPWGPVAARAGLVLVVWIAGFLVSRGVGLDDADKIASIVSGVAAVTMLVLGFVDWWGRQRGPAGAGAVADVLGVVSGVVVQRRAALQARGVTFTDPLPVPWVLVETPDRHAERLPLLGAGGVVGELAAAVAGGPPRGLLILGASGSGKSTVADLALLHHAERTPGGAEGPLPFRVHVGTWDTREELVSWAIRQVLRACREAGVPIRDRRAVRTAITTGALFLLLDGFDELPEGYAGRAFSRVRESGLPRYVLLSQSRAYADELHGSVDVVELGALSGEDAGRALMPGPRRRMDDWAAVARRVAAEPDGPLGTVLRRPLYSGLARRMRDGGMPVPPVLQSAEADPADMEAALLDGVIDAAFSEDGPRRSSRYSRDRARSYLRTVARVMAAEHREDFTWWRLPSLTPWWAQAAVAGFLTWLLVHVVFEVLLGLENLGSSTLGVLVALALAAAGDARPPWPWRRKLLSTAPRRLGAVVAVLVTAGYFAGPSPTGLNADRAVEGMVTGTLMGLMMAGILGLGAKSLAGEGRGARWLAHWREGGLPRRPGWRVTPGKVLVAVGLGALGLLPVATRLLPGVEAVEPAPDVSAGVVAFALITALTVVATSYGAAIRTPPSDRLARAVRANLYYGATAGLLWFAVVMLVVTAVPWMMMSPTDRGRRWQGLQEDLGVEGWQAGLLLALVILVVGTAASVVGMVVCSAGRFAVAGTLLFLAGRWPRPTATFSFLRSAHDRGVLRQSGHAYTFMHASLRQTLSGDRSEESEQVLADGSPRATV